MPLPSATVPAVAESEELEALTRKIAEVRQHIQVTGETGYRSYLGYLVDKRDRIRSGIEAAGGGWEARVVPAGEHRDTPTADPAPAPEPAPEPAPAPADHPAMPGPSPVSTRNPDAGRFGAAAEEVIRAARTGEPAVLGPEHRDGITTWERARNPKAFEHAEDLSLGRYLRGVVTGDWDEREWRFMSEAGTGVNLVPTPLAANIIDRARNATRVLQAGGRVVPMDSATLKIARITGDPTASWRAENAAIAETDGTLDAVTFTARSLSFHIKISRELIEDSAPSVEAVLRSQVAAVVALELDRVALRGSGTAPEPRGIVNQTGVTLLAHGTNGSTIGSPPAAGVMGSEFLVDAIGAVRNSNFEPNAQIMAPRTEQSLAKLRDTTNQYIAPPRYLDDVPRLLTKQVPINLTTGTSTDTSEVYTGQWDSLMIGMRTSLQISLLDQPFMISAGQVALLAWLRADVQLAQPAAFAVDQGVRS